MLDIRLVDPEDLDATEAFAAIGKESETFENPYPVPFSAEDLREEFRNTDSTVNVRGWLGYDGATPVATASLELFMSDNTDKAFLRVAVAPEHRNRGHGSQLLAHVLDQARGAGRTQALTSVRYAPGADESHPYRRFVSTRGFRFSLMDVHRVLSLPPDDQLLERLWVDAEPHFTGDYTLADYEGLVPEEMRPAYCVLLNQIMVDAPSGDITFEEGRATPETLVERDRARAATGRTSYITVALDAEGVPVAHNVLVLPAGKPEIFNHDTLVRRDHRGHRLGLATKIRNLRRVCELHPDRTIVHTWNAESNTPMVAVNDAMGFVPVMHGGEYVLDL